LRLIGEFLEGRNRPTQKAQAFLQFWDPLRQLLRPTGRRYRQRRPQPAKRAEHHQDHEHGRNPARQMDPLEHSHRRLQHEAEHKREHDRQHDFGGHITGGEHG
jgi:hypothetical protein